MKKIVLMFGWMALVTQFSIADEITADENHVIENDFCDTKDDHNGLYGGIGVGVAHTKDKAKLKAMTGSGNITPTNLSYGAGGTEKVRGDAVVLSMLNGHNVPATEVVSQTTDANGLTSAISWKAAIDKELIKETNTGVKGWLVLGYGHMFGNAYVGAEISCDVGKNTDKIDADRTRTATYGTTNKVQIKQTGIIPAIAARFGTYVNGVLVFVKGGYAAPKVTLNTAHLSVDTRLDSPIVGAGIERSLNGFVVRAEVEHRLHTKKTKTVATPAQNLDIFSAGNKDLLNMTDTVNLSSEGTTFRVAVVRSVKF
jgi:hypothetical protein